MKKKTQSKSATKLAVAKPPVASKKVTSVSPRPVSRRLVTLLSLLFLLGILTFFAVKKYKGLVVAGTVNGRPIFRLELEVALNDRYGSTVYEDLASNALLRQLAANNKVVASQEDVKNEIAATEKRLGGKEALQSTLDRLGYSDARFKQEMETQVLVQKLALKLFKAEVTDEEISKYFQDNKALFPNKTLDQVKEDIKQNLVQQKVQQQFSSWFADERKKAVIKSYL